MQKIKCSKCKQEMDCPEYMLVASKHLCASCFDELEESAEFINLAKLLKNDTAEVKEIKSLFTKEEHYADLLGPIEYIIANSFIGNKKLNDKDVEKALKNIKKNYLNDLDFFKIDIEKDIMSELSFSLQERNLTHHELKLILSYLLWCIDNRSWMADNQAYVKWVAYFFKLFDKKDMKKYEDSLIKKATIQGASKEKIDTMLLKTDENICDVEENMHNEIDSEYFSLDDDKKFDFVIKNFMENSFLLENYMAELEDKKDHETNKKFYNEILKNLPDFPPIEIALGITYQKTRNSTLARIHLENALKAIEEETYIIPEEEKKILINEINSQLKKIK